LLKKRRENNDGPVGEDQEDEELNKIVSNVEKGADDNDSGKVMEKRLLEIL
jgi:hypothetical protein